MKLVNALNCWDTFVSCRHLTFHKQYAISTVSTFLTAPQLSCLSRGYIVHFTGWHLHELCIMLNTNFIRTLILSLTTHESLLYWTLVFRPISINLQTKYPSFTSCTKLRLKLTRKPSYHKDDCTMRQIYGCPENFRESLSTPTATFPEIFNGLLLQSMLWMGNQTFCTIDYSYHRRFVPLVDFSYLRSLVSPKFLHVPNFPWE